MGTGFIVAYENRMAYKIPCMSCFLTTMFNNCTSAEQSENRCFTDECRDRLSTEKVSICKESRRGPGNLRRVGGVAIKVV